MTPTQDDETLQDLFTGNLRDEENAWEQPPDKGPIPREAVAEYEDRPASAPVAQFIPPALIRLPKGATPAPAPAPEEAPLPAPPMPPLEPDELDAGLGALATTGKPDTAGAGGDAGAVAPPTPTTPPKEDEPDLSYETWLTSHPQKPVGDNYSWLARAGETANAAGVGRKPDYGWVNKLDEEGAAKAAAPQKAYGQWLLAQKTQSEITKNNREREAPSVAAGVRAGSAERVAQINAAIKDKEREAKYAFGGRKLALESEIAGLKNELGYAGLATKESVAAKGIQASENRFNAAQKITQDRDIAHQKVARTTELTDKINAQNAIAGTLAEFERLAPGSTAGSVDNLPGAFDQTAAKIPIIKAFLASADANKVQQLRNDLSAQIALLRSGKALNEVELKNLAEFLGSDWVARPEALANALRLVKKGLHRHVLATEANYGTHGNEADKYAVLDDVLRSIPESITSRSPMFRDVGGMQVAPAAQAPSGEPDLQPGEVLMVDPDGVHHAVLEKDVQLAEEKAGYRRL